MSCDILTFPSVQTNIGGAGFRVENIKEISNFFLKVATPRDPITERQMMIGMYNHFLSKVFRFHYHSQKVIGSLGNKMSR